MPQFLYSFFFWWASGLVPCLCYCELCCYKYSIVAVPQRRTWCTEPIITCVDPDWWSKPKFIRGIRLHTLSPYCFPLLVGIPFVLYITPGVLIYMLFIPKVAIWCCHANTVQWTAILCSLTFQGHNVLLQLALFITYIEFIPSLIQLIFTECLLGK